MKHNNNMKHLFRMLGIGALSVAIAGCGSTGGKTKKTNTATVQDAQLADIEKTSLKKYGADEKTKDGMRVQNSDGTYTYGVANVSSKFRKDEGVSVGYDDNSKIYSHVTSLNGDAYNSIAFDKTENNELVGIGMNIKIDDSTLEQYKKAGMLPANATKKTAKKMVEKEIAYIRNILKQDDIDEDSVDKSSRLAVVDYEYQKRGYYMDLSNKEKNDDGIKPKYTNYISDAVETYMIDLGNGNFSAGIIFNIGSGKWNAGNKAIQIIGQRYGFDSLCKDDKYSTDLSKTGGIIKALMNVYNFSNDGWTEICQFHIENITNSNTYEVDDEFYKLSIS